MGLLYHGIEISSSYLKFIVLGKHPITIPKHEPIKRIYVEMFRKVVEITRVLKT